MFQGKKFTLTFLFYLLSGSALNAFATDAPSRFSADSALTSASPITASEWDLKTQEARPWFTVTSAADVLEGPAFDRDNNLVLSDSTAGKVLRLTRERRLSVLATFLGETPAGIAIHRDGRIFVTLLSDNYSKGRIVSLDPGGQDSREIIRISQGYAPDDLVFDRKGGFYFSDFRGSTTEPRGGVYYVSPDLRTVTPVVRNLASANGIGLSPDGKTLWVTEFGRNVLHRITLQNATTPSPLGTSAVYRFTGPSPDSLRVDSQGYVYVAVMGQGRVMVFAPNGVPVAQILLPQRDKGHNLATASLVLNRDSQQMYVVAGDLSGHSGATVFRAHSLHNGMVLYSHQ